MGFKNACKFKYFVDAWKFDFTLLLTTSVKTAECRIYLPLWAFLVRTPQMICWFCLVQGINPLRYRIKLELLQEPILKEFLENTLKVYDLRKRRFFRIAWASEPAGPAFDSRLAKYLLSTVENNEISTISESLWSDLHSRRWDLLRQGGQEGNFEREKFLEHLARKS